MDIYTSSFNSFNLCALTHLPFAILIDDTHRAKYGLYADVSVYSHRKWVGQGPRKSGWANGSLPTLNHRFPKNNGRNRCCFCNYFMLIRVTSWCVGLFLF